MFIGHMRQKLPVDIDRWVHIATAMPVEQLACGFPILGSKSDDFSPLEFAFPNVDPFAQLCTRILLLRPALFDVVEEIGSIRIAFAQRTRHPEQRRNQTRGQTWHGNSPSPDAV